MYFCNTILKAYDHPRGMAKRTKSFNQGRLGHLKAHTGNKLILKHIRNSNINDWNAHFQSSWDCSPTMHGKCSAPLVSCNTDSTRTLFQQPKRAESKTNNKTNHWVTQGWPTPHEVVMGLERWSQASVWAQGHFLQWWFLRHCLLYSPHQYRPVKQPKHSYNVYHLSQTRWSYATHHHKKKEWNGSNIPHNKVESANSNWWLFIKNLRLKAFMQTK